MTATHDALKEEPPLHLKWDDYRRSITWEASEWGFQRGRSPALELEGVTAFATILPLGQGSRPAIAAADMVFVGGQGEVEITVNGAGYLVGSKDVLHIAAASEYSYNNVSFEPVVMFEAVGASASGAPLETQLDYQPWSTARRGFNWDLPMASDWGNHRGSGPHVLSQQLRGHLVQMPSSQSCPWHAGSRQTAFFQIDGVVEFHTANEVWQLNRFDLFATRRSAYIYSNPTFESAVFFDIGGPPPPDGRTRYFESDPGFPTRPDAIELETVVGFEGERRLVRKDAKLPK
jgi:mannose-6-phosphate isomerase-like protein (cupin superfamily)